MSDYDGPERRREDVALARWQGEVEARVATLERLQRGLVQDVSDMSKSLVRVEGGIENCLSEVRSAAAQIEKGKQDAVTKLEATITATAAERQAWKVTKFQVFVAGLLTLAIAVISTLISLAIVGTP